MGFKPDELLDLTLLQYNACVLGAADRQRDELAAHIQGAYYSAYWNNAKRPESLQKVLKKIYADPKAPKPDVDVNKFLERKRRLEQNGGSNNQQKSGLRTPRK